MLLASCVTYNYVFGDKDNTYRRRSSLNTRNAFRAQKENLHMSKTVPAIDFAGQFSTDHNLEVCRDVLSSGRNTCVIDKFD